MTVQTYQRIQEAIRGEGHDGWLFSNFHHRDHLSDQILGLETDSTNSRPWIYAVPAQGEPVRIVHAIESGILDSLPGSKVVYSGRNEFIAALSPLGKRRWGAHLSAELPVISYLDVGMASTLEAAGLILLPAAALIQRLNGLLDRAGIESHERAAAGLYAIVRESWAMISKAHSAGEKIREGDVRQAILDGMAARGLETDHPPIVAAGAHAGDPHFDFAGDGAEFCEGDVIQLDLWAKERTPNSIYADISWVGIFGERASTDVEQAFTALIGAREAAISFIESELSEGRRPTGASVDEQTRAKLIAVGYRGALRHRTGHGIDTECHGSGVNIDSVEFPDGRILLDGACFSLEPGIYFDHFGLRTEVDAYVENGKLFISGDERQRNLLFCEARRS